jgi:6-phosphogluconolactonase (cycloisomerase 2 family)
MRRTLIGAALVAAALTTATTIDARAPEAQGAVYTATNKVTGNEVLMFDRAANGALTYVNAFATGGTGSGDSLGNQGGVASTDDGRFVLVVNAGSNDISVLETTRDGLVLRDRESSGGQRPISVTVNRRLVYVLNAGGAVGGSDSVVGFWLSRNGDLTMIASSERGLSAPVVGPAEAELSPDGSSLIVTEKTTNRVDIFAVEGSGLLGASMSYASSGQTPFGFAFGKRDQFFVSEAFGGAANASAISSYQVTGDATIGVISPSVPTTETAACWVVVSGDGNYLYTTNAGSGTVSGFSIRHDGTIALLDANGVTGTTGAGVTDVALSGNGRYLYALRSGAGAIVSFRVENHGGLTAIGSTAIPTGAGANGLIAR